MSEKPQTVRAVGPDLVRCVAVIFVVSLHFFLHTIFYETLLDGIGMLAASWVRMLVMSCVPLFLMLSGYLCCRRKWSLSLYRKALPMLAVYLLASIVCFSFKAAQAGESVELLPLVQGILSFTAAPYSWYVEMYLQLFLMMPFLNLAWNHGSEQEHHAIVITAVVLGFAAATLDHWGHILPNYFPNLFPVAYYFMGCWVRDHGEKLKQWVLALGWVGFAGIAAGIAFWLQHGTTFSGLGNDNLLTALSSFCLFAFLVQVQKLPNPVLRIVRTLASMALPIFLISYIPDSLVYPALVGSTTFFKEQFILMPVVVLALLVMDVVLAAPIHVAADALVMLVPGQPRLADGPVARCRQGWQKLRQSFLCAVRPEAELSKGRKVLFWAWNLFWILAAAGVLGILSLVLATGDRNLEVFTSYFNHPMVLLLNLLPPALLILLLYGLLGRAWLACLITALPVLGLSIANYFKLVFRDDPILASDLLLIKEAGKMLDNYHLYPAFRVVIAIAVGVVLVVLLSKLAKGKPKLPWRLVPAALSVAAAIAVVPKYTSAAVYDANAAYEHLNYLAETQVYMARGFLYPFLHSTAQLFPNPPDGYDEAAIQNLIAQHQDADIPEDKKVNIVGIMLEAFADFSGYDSIEFQQDVYAPYHALEAEGYSGTLVDNIFAGGTVNTERAFLTGLLTSDYTFRQDSAAYPWYLKSQGYKTSGDHPCYEWFYNRLNTNPHLGIDTYRYVENYYGALTGDTVALDSIFFPELEQSIFQQLEADDTPLFSFSVSYQGHGPYEKDKCWWGEIEDYIANENLTTESRYILANYLGSVKDTAQHIADLADAFREREEPIVLVIFGDHKPWMGNGNTVYQELGIDLTSGSEEALMNYWTTRYLFWANDAAKEVLGTNLQGEGPAVAPCFLMNLLFQQLGWTGDAYMQTADTFMDTFPVIHNSGFCFNADGQLVTELTPEQKNLVQQFRCLSYYRKTHFTQYPSR